MKRLPKKWAITIIIQLENISFMPWIRPKEESKEDMDRFFKDCRGRARFLVDESLGIGVTMALRREGWNVKDVSEVDLKGHSDEDVFEYAKRESRILLTHDEGFFDDKRYPLGRNPGVIVLPGAEGNELALLRALGLIYPRYPGFYEETKISVSEDGTMIIKRLTESGIITNKFRFPDHGLLMWVDENEN